MRYLLALVLFVATLAAAQTVTIHASDVFVPPSQAVDWMFHDEYGNSLSINVWTGGPTTYLPANTVIWSYDKSACLAYWAPGICSAHLDFPLVKQPDGSYVSVASLMTFPYGCSWCVGWTLATMDVQAAPGEPTPYLIIPAVVTFGRIDVVDTDYIGYWKTGTTTFESIVGLVPPSAPTHWRTMSYVEYVTTPQFSGYAMVSEQWEGPCFDSTGAVYSPQSGCTHEKWYFAPALGLVKIQVFAPTNDRNLDMVR